METLIRVALAVGACSVPFAIMIGIWYASYHRQRRRRLAYLARHKLARPNATREKFVAWFVGRGVHQSVAVTVYDELRRRCSVPDFPLTPDDGLEQVCDIVVHEELDELLHAMGYRELEDCEWEAIDWDALQLLPPSEPDAPVASLVYLVDALHKSRHVASDTSARRAT